MRHSQFAASMCLSAVLMVGFASPAGAQFYEQHNLVSDGFIAADLIDPSLVNPWGLTASATSPWWVANNFTAVSTIYNGAGAKQALVVTVPGAPTGVVFNGNVSTTIFVVPSHGRARFLFASEDGTISGWPGSGTMAFVVVDHMADGAVYKGLAIGSSTNTAVLDRLYATNFHAGTVDVFDGNFNPVAGGFVNPTIPHGYAPFGIQNVNGTIYVTYARQDKDKHDDVPGKGHGYVNAFDTAGNLLQRVASKGKLNSPWGLALAPADFGKFSGDLLVGNFGDGHIHAFDPMGKPDKKGDEFKPQGALHSAEGKPLQIDGLWALEFGNGASAGPKTTLFFTAGPGGETHGLFGTLVVAPPPDEH